MTPKKEKYSSYHKKSMTTSWVYGEGRQGRRPTSLFVGLTPLSDLSPWRKRRQKMIKNKRKRKNRRKCLVWGRMRVSELLYKFGLSFLA